MDEGRDSFLNSIILLLKGANNSAKIAFLTSFIGVPQEE
jgi:hypothetical protein